MPTQQRLPRTYLDATQPELEDRIAAARQHLGDSLVILGHHYQRDEVIRFADFTGDSLKLSRLASEQKAKYIVFCGVHFMAESADVLSSDDQQVILPHMLAGCNMADLAEDAAVDEALGELGELSDGPVIPVSYVNSSAAIKAITARGGGACCTSSNVRNVFEWALRDASQGGAGGKRILAVPDQHLARNTAVAMGYGLDDCAVYDPKLPDGGLSAEQVAAATFILWKGHCYVHQRFRPEHVEKVRREHPDIQVIVHPECPREVVELADAAGSTEQIIRAVADSKPGEKYAIGTESNLVNRLAGQYPDRLIRTLSDAPALCAMMHRIDLPHLAWALDHLVEGRVVNRVSVPADIAADARVALQRMIDIRPAAETTRRR